MPEVLDPKVKRVAQAICLREHGPIDQPYHFKRCKSCREDGDLGDEGCLGFGYAYLAEITMAAARDLQEESPELYARLLDPPEEAIEAGAKALYDLRRVLRPGEINWPAWEDAGLLQPEYRGAAQRAYRHVLAHVFENWASE